MFRGDLERNSLMRRDLPNAGLAEDERDLAFASHPRAPTTGGGESSSSLRPTSGVRARAPPRGLPPLARTIRNSVVRRRARLSRDKVRRDPPRRIGRIPDAAREQQP